MQKNKEEKETLDSITIAFLRGTLIAVILVFLTDNLLLGLIGFIVGATGFSKIRK